MISQGLSSSLRCPEVSKGLSQILHVSLSVFWSLSTVSPRFDLIVQGHPRTCVLDGSLWSPEVFSVSLNCFNDLYVSVKLSETPQVLPCLPTFAEDRWNSLRLTDIRQHSHSLKFTDVRQSLPCRQSSRMFAGVRNDALRNSMVVWIYPRFSQVLCGSSLFEARWRCPKALHG